MPPTPDEKLSVPDMESKDIKIDIGIIPCHLISREFHRRVYLLQSLIDGSQGLLFSIVIHMVVQCGLLEPIPPFFVWFGLIGLSFVTMVPIVVGFDKFNKPSSAWRTPFVWYLISLTCVGIVILIYSLLFLYYMFTVSGVMIDPFAPLLYAVYVELVVMSVLSRCLYKSKTSSCRWTAAWSSFESTVLLTALLSLPLVGMVHLFPETPTLGATMLAAIYICKGISCSLVLFQNERLIQEALDSLARNEDPTSEIVRGKLDWEVFMKYYCGCE